MNFPKDNLFSGSKSTKPFLIVNEKRKKNLINIDEEVFDDTVDSKVRFVQGVNAFLTIKLTYDACTMAYYFWSYMDTCMAYSNLMIGFLACNLLWVITSIIGFNSINTRNHKRVKIFFLLLFLVLITRITLYVIMGLVMSDYIVLTDGESANDTEDVVCSSIYQQGLVILEGSVEGILLLVLLFMVRIIYIYLVRWENKDLQKFFNDNKAEF